MRKIIIFASFFIFLLTFPNSNVAQQISIIEEYFVNFVKEIQKSTVEILTYNESGILVSRGMGFFVDKKGTIISNRHLFFGISKAIAVTYEGDSIPVLNVIAEDKRADLIKISSKKIPKGSNYLELEVDIPEIWEPVFAIGYALSIGRTISYGFIHSILPIPTFGEVYSNTLPLPDASSGTPVINREGKVSGITVFITHGDTNYHCAIPSIRIAIYLTI
ncbi:unnamed protein product [marine sediment metagenome]|uniref:Serine protease n=1 Tax=marine sediment metagenome TaxID=412755 RepID=X0ZZA6_9ZZZZ